MTSWSPEHHELIIGMSEAVADILVTRAKDQSIHTLGWHLVFHEGKWKKEHACAFLWRVGCARALIMENEYYKEVDYIWNRENYDPHGGVWPRVFRILPSDDIPNLIRSKKPCPYNPSMDYLITKFLDIGRQAHWDLGVEYGLTSTRKNWRVPERSQKAIYELSKLGLVEYQRGIAKWTDEVSPYFVELTLWNEEGLSADDGHRWW